MPLTIQTSLQNNSIQLNLIDNEIMATMIGNFNDGAAKENSVGLWMVVLDQLDGMTNQINTLSNMGVISWFIGMLTTREAFFLSKTRVF